VLTDFGGDINFERAGTNGALKMLSAWAFVGATGHGPLYAAVASRDPDPNLATDLGVRWPSLMRYGGDQRAGIARRWQVSDATQGNHFDGADGEAVFWHARKLGSSSATRFISMGAIGAVVELKAKAAKIDVVAAE